MSQKKTGCCGCIVGFFLILLVIVGISGVGIYTLIPNSVKSQISDGIVIAQDEVTQIFLNTKGNKEESLKAIQDKGYNVALEGNTIIITKGNNYKLIADMTPIDYHNNKGTSITSDVSSISLIKDGKTYTIDITQLIPKD